MVFSTSDVDTLNFNKFVKGFSGGTSKVASKALNNVSATSTWNIFGGEGEAASAPKSDSLFLKSEAVNSFASGLKLFPYDSSFALKSAQALAAAGDHEKAVNAIDYAERIDPNNSLVTAYRGMIDYAFGLFAEAKLCFEEVEKSHSEEAQAIARRGLKAIEEQDRKKNIPSD